MTQSNLNDRVEALEKGLKQLRKQVAGGSGSGSRWDGVVGAFAGDKDFIRASRIGAAFRRSQRPKTARKAKRAS